MNPILIAHSILNLNHVQEIYLHFTLSYSNFIIEDSRKSSASDPMIHRVRNVLTINANLRYHLSPESYTDSPSVPLSKHLLTHFVRQSDLQQAYDANGNAIPNEFLARAALSGPGILLAPVPLYDTAGRKALTEHILAHVTNSICRITSTDNPSGRNSYTHLSSAIDSLGICDHSPYFVPPCAHSWEEWAEKLSLRLNDDSFGLSDKKAL